MENFSGALRLVGTDDHINPSQACIKPVEVKRKEIPSSKVSIQIEGDGQYVEVTESGDKEILETAKITLNDCLACSGCVTSAETILITAQSMEEFFATISKKEKEKKTAVISISPQSRASIAAHFGLSTVEAHQRLITLFKSWGADFVFDTSFSRDFTLLETRAEFLSRLQESQKTGNPMQPILCSVCPGWICYAEKTHGEFILPSISTAKSPQQVMGTLVKNYFAEKTGLSGASIYHCSVMPCYDKKLEASRDDFFDAKMQTREVDTVLTSIEILNVLKERNIDFKALTPSPIMPLFTNAREEGGFFGSHGGSGGYLEETFKYAAKTLYGKDITELKYKPGRNPDFQEVTLEVEGKVVLHFALCYGFRNIQNLVRKIKTNTCPYQFVEVMACPSGCINGGGQIRATPPENPKDFVRRVEALYHLELQRRSPDENPAVKEIYSSWLTEGPYSKRAKELFHTQYHAREKFQNKLAIKW